MLNASLSKHKNMYVHMMYVIMIRVAFRVFREFQMALP